MRAHAAARPHPSRRRCAPPQDGAFETLARAFALAERLRHARSSDEDGCGYNGPGARASEGVQKSPNSSNMKAGRTASAPPRKTGQRRFTEVSEIISESSGPRGFDGGRVLRSHTIYRE